MLYKKYFYKFYIKKSFQQFVLVSQNMLVVISFPTKLKSFNNLQRFKVTNFLVRSLVLNQANILSEVIGFYILISTNLQLNFIRELSWSFFFVPVLSLFMPATLWQQNLSQEIFSFIEGKFNHLSFTHLKNIKQ